MESIDLPKSGHEGEMGELKKKIDKNFNRIPNDIESNLGKMKSSDPEDILQSAASTSESEFIEDQNLKIERAVGEPSHNLSINRLAREIKALKESLKLEKNILDSDLESYGDKNIGKSIGQQKVEQTERDIMLKQAELDKLISLN